MIENILFPCDQKQCPNCSYPTCKHTYYLNHSKTYKLHPGKMLMDVHDPEKFTAIPRNDHTTDYWEKEQ